MNFSTTKTNPIVLKEENRKYAYNPADEILGYAKLEQKGDKSLLIVIVDNLKFFPGGEYIYKVILSGIIKEKRRYHMIGDISLSAYGKGEGSFRINSSDMDGSGSPLEDFSTIIVAAMSQSNNREALHPVLIGDFAEETGETHAKGNSPSPKDYSPFYNRYVLENCINIAKKQNDFSEIIPFKYNNLHAAWKKITRPEVFPMIAPGAEKPVKKYGHFLFGWSDTYYFLGVPGRFFPDEQPDEGKSGFIYWQPILGMESKNEDTTIPLEERRKTTYGYWIAAINRYNGHIEEIPLIEK